MIGFLFYYFDLIWLFCFDGLDGLLALLDYAGTVGLFHFISL